MNNRSKAGLNQDAMKKNPSLKKRSR